MTWVLFMLLAQAHVSQFQWDQDGPTLATVSAYTYKIYADGATTGTPLTPVACAGAATPFTCTVSMPTFSPGSHSVALTASDVNGESQKGALLAFNVPTAPTGFQVTP